MDRRGRQSAVGRGSRLPQHPSSVLPSADRFPARGQALGHALRRTALAGMIALALALGAARADPNEFRLALDPGDHDRVLTPLAFTLLLPDSLRGASYVTATLLDGSGQPTHEPIQAAVAEDQVTLFWVEPALAAGVVSHRTVNLARARAPSAADVADGFRFIAGPDWRELRYGDQTVWRRSFGFNAAHPQDTPKPWLNLAGFHDEGFVTKGPGGFYARQSGLFLGWNPTRFEGRDYDFWSCESVVQHQTGFLPGRDLAGGVVARDAAVTDWVAPDGRPIVRDTREFTAWHTGAAELVLDTVITLEAPSGAVALGGDAHHGGWQLRAANEVRDHAVDTFFFRSAGARSPSPDVWEQAGWVAMVFRIGARTYTLTDMNHPENPEPTRFATRDYGRIGTTFAATLAVGHPRILRHRFLLQEAAPRTLTVSTQTQRYRDFADPVKIRIE